MFYYIGFPITDVDLPMLNNQFVVVCIRRDGRQNRVSKSNYTNTINELTLPTSYMTFNTFKKERKIRLFRSTNQNPKYLLGDECPRNPK